MSAVPGAPGSSKTGASPTAQRHRGFVACPAMEARDPELKKELDATLQARGDLGAEYESALIESFLEKIEQRLDSTVDRRVRRQLAEQQMVVARGNRAPSDPGGFGERFGFGIISLIMAIPLSAIASAQADLPGLVVAWLGIVGVNVVHASAIRAVGPSQTARVGVRLGRVGRCLEVATSARRAGGAASAAGRLCLRGACDRKAQDRPPYCRTRAFRQRRGSPRGLEGHGESCPRRGAADVTRRRGRRDIRDTPEVPVRRIPETRQRRPAAGTGAHPAVTRAANASRFPDIRVSRSSSVRDSSYAPERSFGCRLPRRYKGQARSAQT